MQEKFPCNVLDPMTGLATEHFFNLYIGCDESVTGRMVIDSTIEQSQCRYYVSARHVAACPISAKLDFSGKV